MPSGNSQSERKPIGKEPNQRASGVKFRNRFNYVGKISVL